MKGGEAEPGNIHYPRVVLCLLLRAVPRKSPRDPERQTLGGGESPENARGSGLVGCSSCEQQEPGLYAAYGRAAPAFRSSPNSPDFPGLQGALNSGGGGAWGCVAAPAWRLEQLSSIPACLSKGTSLLRLGAMALTPGCLVESSVQTQRLPISFLKNKCFQTGLIL